MARVNGGRLRPWVAATMMIAASVFVPAHAGAAVQTGGCGNDFAGHWVSPAGGWTVTGSNGSYTATSDYGPTYPMVKVQASGGVYSFDILHGTDYVSHNHGTFDCTTSTGHFSDSYGHEIDYVAHRVGTPPTATFTSIQDDTDPFTFAFDGTNSISQVAGEKITDWSWDFGDATSGNGTRVTHKFAKIGHYNVILTVTDSTTQKGTYTVGLDVTSLEVRLDPGTTNGQLFSVDVTVKNAGTSAVSNLAFDDPRGIVANTAVAVAATSGSIEEFGPLTPDMPDTLAVGESATSTVTFTVVQEGGIDLISSVTATDASGNRQTGHTAAKVQIGTRKLSSSEIEQMYTGMLQDASTRAGDVFDQAQIRYGQIMAWASGNVPGGGLPAWLMGPVADGTTTPAGAVPDPVGWKVSAARAAGLADNALAWLPDDPTAGVQAYLHFEAHLATSSANVVKSTVSGAATGTVNALSNAADFYGRLSVGDPAFKADAANQLNGLVNDVGAAAAPKIAVVGAILAMSHDDPQQVGAYADSPVLQQFTKDSNAVIDANLTAAQNKLVALAKLAKTNPNGAADQIGDIVGTTFTGAAMTIAANEFGAGLLTRAGKAVEGAIGIARTGDSLDAAVTLGRPGGTLSAASTGARQTLESLGEETVITPAQLQQLGGFYGADAPKVQQIIADIKTKYGVDVEIQVRPGNPASLQYYADGTGVPKPRWIKPKATEWTDVVLGAPKETLGKATLFDPTLPSPSVMATFTESDQAVLQARYTTQKNLYQKSLDPAGDFQKLLADSKQPGGATVNVGVGSGQQNVTGLKYSLQDVPGHPGVKYIVDDAAGGKFILSDADYQAVVSANTGTHIPAAAGRGNIEREVMNRLASDTVSFGGHGWSHSGTDLYAQFQQTFLEFATGSMSRDDARKTLNYFFFQDDSVRPAWLHKMAQSQGGRAVTVDDLLKAFKVGQFVIKFNGTNMRVGFAAGLR